MWESLSSCPSLEDWLKVQREAKCAVYVCDGGDHSGLSVYWSNYDEVPNRNLIETVMHHEDADLVEMTDGHFEGYQRMTLYIKVLSAADIEDEIDSVHPDGSERECRVWEETLCAPKPWPIRNDF